VKVRLASPPPFRGRGSTEPAALPNRAGETGIVSADPAALLAWYDHNRRRLPWRAKPGERPDPYRVWVSEIMLQQTTVQAVGPYYARFLERFPSLSALAAAPLDDVLKAWAGLGYYARGRNLHACARAVAERHGGGFPADEEALRALPGIGPYTAAAIAAIAVDRRTTPVDGNVERVIARLFAVATPLPAGKPELRRLAATLTPASRAGDFAQALMDLGATICTPKNPACVLCPWREACAARRLGDPAAFPYRTAKPHNAVRRGAAFVVLRDGMLLVRSRGLHGLLGGMTEVPTTAWTPDFDVRRCVEHAPAFDGGPERIKWRRLPGTVNHTFTHFPLELTVHVGRVPRGTRAPAGMRWVPLVDLTGEALPSVMRKVISRALDKPNRHAAPATAASPL
jgi:A/G-specific adenine glycosylase